LNVALDETICFPALRLSATVPALGIEAKMFTIDEGKIIWALFLTVIIVGLIKLNEWYYEGRKLMTPEERKRQDEENHDCGDW